VTCVTVKNDVGNHNLGRSRGNVGVSVRPRKTAETCKTPRWRCWFSGSQPSQWRWKFGDRNNTNKKQPVGGYAQLTRQLHISKMTVLCCALPCPGIVLRWGREDTPLVPFDTCLLTPQFFHLQRSPFGTSISGDGELPPSKYFPLEPRLTMSPRAPN